MPSGSLPSRTGALPPAPSAKKRSRANRDRGKRARQGEKAICKARKDGRMAQKTIAAIHICIRQPGCHALPRPHRAQRRAAGVGQAEAQGGSRWRAKGIRKQRSLRRLRLMAQRHGKTQLRYGHWHGQSWAQCPQMAMQRSRFAQSALPAPLIFCFFPRTTALFRLSAQAAAAYCSGTGCRPCSSYSRSVFQRTPWWLRRRGISRCAS